MPNVDQLRGMLNGLRPRPTMVVAAIGAIFVVGCLCVTCLSAGPTHAPPPSTAPVRTPASAAAVVASPPLTDADHLRLASEILARRTLSYEEVNQADDHLNLIHADAGYDRQVALARRTLHVRRVRVDHDYAVAQAATVRANTAQRATDRRTFAAGYDRALLEQGMEVDRVGTRGPDDTTMRLVWVGCGRSVVTQMASSESGTEFRRRGFRRIECERPYSHDLFWIDL